MPSGLKIKLKKKIKHGPKRKAKKKLQHHLSSFVETYYSRAVQWQRGGEIQISIFFFTTT